MSDEQFLRTPFHGVRRMSAWLQRQGEPVNRKKVWRLMRLMGLMSIYPKPRLSANGAGHKVYAYLLKWPDQAWSPDITIE